MASDSEDVSGSESDSYHRLPNPPEAGPKPKKTEVFLRDGLIKYRMSYKDTPTGWHAYKIVKNREAEFKKAERKRKRDEETPAEQMARKLADAGRFVKSAESLDGQPGKESRAQGMRKSAEKSLKQAKQLYDDLDVEDREAALTNMTPQQRAFITAARADQDEEQTETVLEEYLASTAIPVSDEQQASGQILKLAEERDHLCRKLDQAKKQIRKSKKVSDFMKRNLEELRTITEGNPAATKKIQHMLKLVVESSETVTKFIETEITPSDEKPST